LKLVIGSLVIFSIVILFLFALFPADISVTRLVQISRPGAEVRKKIVDLREWTSWNLFSEFGSDKSISYAMGKIDSSHIHEVYVDIDLLKATPDSIFTIWQHDGKFFKGNYILNGIGEQTTLVWILQFHVKWYPWEKLASMFYDKQLGPIMEKSLINLRDELEAGTE
jgi:hypothetical protein